MSCRYPGRRIILYILKMLIVVSAQGQLAKLLSTCGHDQDGLEP